MITRLQLHKFTAFDDIDIQFSPGINIIIGRNGTGKTHIMKVLYDACKVSDSTNINSLDQELISDFAPYGNKINRLVRRSVGNDTANIKVYRKANNDNDAYLSSNITTRNRATTTSRKWREQNPLNATFIPVKDMLANGASFAAMVDNRIISLEGIYTDIIKKALIPTVKGKRSAQRKKLLNILQKEMSGYVVEKNGDFFLRSKSGNLEFTLLAEGYRKLGLLWTLIQNDSLANGSVLFWDEPEANLNPRLAKIVVDILLELQREGVQIFIATHDYVLLKEFDLTANKEDKVSYHSLYKDEGESVQCSSTDNFSLIGHNAIDEAYDSLLDRELSKQY